MEPLLEKALKKIDGSETAHRKWNINHRRPVRNACIMERQAKVYTNIREERHRIAYEMFVNNSETSRQRPTKYRNATGKPGMVNEEMRRCPLLENRKEG